MKLMKALTTATIQLGIEAAVHKDKVYLHAKIVGSTWGANYWFFEAEDKPMGLDPKLAGSDDFEMFDPDSEWQQEYIKKHFPSCLSRFVPKTVEKHPLKG